MQVWSTSDPLALPIDVARVSRVDLEFIDVRRDLGTFTMFAFLLNAGDDLSQDAGRDHENFAAGYTVFAQKGCWGEDGHCDWKRGPVSAFDRRPQHHLLPFNLTLDVTETVRRLGNPDALQLTIRATQLDDPEATDFLRFRRVALLAYQ